MEFEIVDTPEKYMSECSKILSDITKLKKNWVVDFINAYYPNSTQDENEHKKIRGRIQNCIRGKAYTTSVYKPPMLFWQIREYSNKLKLIDFFEKAGVKLKEEIRKPGETNRFPLTVKHGSINITINLS